VNPGWFNDNRFRAFPFQVGTVAALVGSPTTIERLDNSTVVDAGFVMGLNSGYIDGEHSVWLDRLDRLGSVLTFTFRSDAPGLYKKPLLFARNITDLLYTVQYVDDVEDAYGISEVSDSAVYEVSEGTGDEYADCIPEPLWSGFLVTGYFDNLLAVLTGNGSLTRTIGGLLEPALVRNTANSYVASLNLVNQDRTRVTAPDGCPPIESPFPVSPTGLYVNARCLQGDVRFIAGYNCALRQEDFNNAIIFGAAVGAGAGQVCNDPPVIFPGEIPPDGSSLLEGGSLCNEVIRSINGVGGKFSSLLSGPGVNIQAVPAQSKVIVNVNMSQLAICYEMQTFSEVSEVV
jgi:hypothetical protein